VINFDSKNSVLSGRIALNYFVLSHKKTGEGEQRTPQLSQDGNHNCFRMWCITLTYRIWNHICIGRHA